VASVGITSGHVSGVSIGSVNISYTTGSLCTVIKRITVMPMAAGHGGPLAVSASGGDWNTLQNVTYA
jgi:hypothetical protein